SYRALLQARRPTRASISRRAALAAPDRGPCAGFDEDAYQSWLPKPWLSAARWLSRPGVSPGPLPSGARDREYCGLRPCQPLQSGQTIQGFLGSQIVPALGPLRLRRSIPRVSVASSLPCHRVVYRQHLIDGMICPQDLYLTYIGTA